MPHSKVNKVSQRRGDAKDFYKKELVGMEKGKKKTSSSALARFNLFEPVNSAAPESTVPVNLMILLSCLKSSAGA